MYFSKREKKGKNRHTRQITSKVKSNDTVKVIGAVRAQNMRKRIRREVSGTKPDKGTKCYFRAEYSHYVNSQPLNGLSPRDLSTIQDASCLMHCREWVQR